MNYLLAETFQPEKKRVHPPEAATFTGPSPRARFGRLKRGNMKQSGTPSSAFCRSNGVLSAEYCRGLAIDPLLHYSITPSLHGKSNRRPIHSGSRFLATR